MKRNIAALILMLCVMLLLTACGAVSETEKAIDKIGNVTMDSLSAIEYAEQLYRSLDPSQQAKVDNYGVLVEARSEYERKKLLISDAIAAIDAIGEVTKKSDTAVGLAQNAYWAAAAAGVDGYVTNYPVLQAAEEAYAQILLKQAEKLLGQKKYEDAYLAYSDLAQRFGHTGAGAMALEGQAASRVGTAKKYISAKKLADARWELNAAIEICGETESIREAEEKLVKALEKNRPKNGKIFKNTAGKGKGELIVTAGTQDACVKLENLQDPDKYILFYVRAGKTVTVKVKDGYYYLKYVSGQYWYDQDEMFGLDGAYCQAESSLEYLTYKESGSTYYTTYEMTLYEVVGGNMTTMDIDPQNF